MDSDRLWRLARLVPAIYDFAVERERLAVLGGRLLWGADVAPMYRGFAELRRLPPGAAVLDVPCGGGVAFRGLPPAARGARGGGAGTGRKSGGGGEAGAGGIRYVAADLSPMMLARARGQASRRGRRVAFARASVARLPFRDGVFDLVLSYNGLHCFTDPAGALVEMARVLRPGGVLRGTAVVRGSGRRQDACIALLQRTGEFGRVGDADDLRAELAAVPLENVGVEPSGAVAYFTAARPG